MTNLEKIWADKHVFVYSMMSKSGKIHSYVRRWIGRIGVVVRESKNNQLLVKFGISQYKRKYIAIPPGCLKQLGDEDFRIALSNKKISKPYGNTNSI